MTKKWLLLLSCCLLAGVSYAQTQGNTASKVSNFAISQEKQNALFAAINEGQRGDLQAVKRIVEDSFVSSLLVNIKDKDGNTPLMLATQKGAFEIVKYLAGKGAYVNTTNKKNYTALCYAAKNNRPKITEYLIDSGAHVDYKCGPEGSEKTPLFLVAENGANAQMIALFVKAAKKAEVDFNFVYETTRYRRYNVLNTAARHAKTVESLRLLIDAGAEIDKDTPMIVMINNRNDEKLGIIKYLLDEKGASLNPLIEPGAIMFALDWARSNKSPKTEAYLIEKGYTKTAKEVYAAHPEWGDDYW